jgi:predicted phage tail protein
MKRKIYLDGELGERYGKELTMNVSSFGEVFQCLEANYPEVSQYLIDCHEKDIGFMCEVAGTPLADERELLLLYQEGDMYISPQPMGSKSGAGKILAAIAIITIAIATQQYWMIEPGGWGAATFTQKLAYVAGMTAFSVGLNLAITGIMQLMAPDPATDSEQDESYLFQGSGQTIIEGDPVPVLYGKLRVPGRPISFSVQNANQAFINNMGYTEESTVPVDTTEGEPDIGEGNQNEVYNDYRPGPPIDRNDTPETPGNSWNDTSHGVGEPLYDKP